MSISFSSSTASRPEPDLSIYFSTSHRECALSCSFSTDGKFIATTSKDAAIKLIDVSKIHDAMARTGGGAGWNENDSKPVLKTFYDHNAAVNDIQFHPNGQVMA